MKDPQSTSDISHEAAQAALEALFVQQDDARAFEEVSAREIQRHIAACETCRRQYDGMALADRLLAVGGEADDPTDLPTAGFEKSFAEASFMGALDDLLDEERGEASERTNNAGGGAAVFDFPPPQSSQSDPTALRAYFGAAAAVLLVAGGAWFSWQQVQSGPTPSPIDAEFQARSAATVPAEGAFAEPTLELLCAENSGEGVEFTSTEDAPFGLLSCPQDAQLKLAYHNRAPELRYAAFFGVDDAGTMYWYGPTPTAIEPVAIEKTARLSGVGESIRLSVNHQPGRVRVYGIFAAEPVDFPTLRRLVDDADTDALVRGDGPESLSIRGTWTSNTFEVTEGGQQ